MDVIDCLLEFIMVFAGGGWFSSWRRRCGGFFGLRFPGRQPAQADQGDVVTVRVAGQFGFIGKQVGVMLKVVAGRQLDQPLLG